MAAQPIQQVPLEQAVAEEGIESFFSLEKEIDKFQFEEEETQGVETVFISESEEETDKYSCVQAPDHLLRGLFGRRGRRDGSKIQHEFEGTDEGEE